jgi:hypothetical protein
MPCYGTPVARAGSNSSSRPPLSGSNRILECAVDGKADIIVSNDHHLLDLKIYAGIPIVAGPDFRRTLAACGRSRFLTVAVL